MGASNASYIPGYTPGSNGQWTQSQLNSWEGAVNKAITDGPRERTRVTPGETLTSIANQHGESLSTLEADNPQLTTPPGPNVIHSGDLVILSSKTPNASEITNATYNLLRQDNQGTAANNATNAKAEVAALEATNGIPKSIDKAINEGLTQAETYWKSSQYQGGQTTAKPTATQTAVSDFNTYFKHQTLSNWDTFLDAVNNSFHPALFDSNPTAQINQVKQIAAGLLDSKLAPGNTDSQDFKTTVESIEQNYLPQPPSSTLPDKA
jgi:hypothetical protein